jgi:hypothetical protein
MILTPGEAILDLPAAHVATIVIVHARQEKARGRGQFGPVVMVKPGEATGVIKRSTALRRVQESELLAETNKKPEIRGMPFIWCVRADGRVQIWPAPLDPYDCEAMGRNGRPIGGQRVAPVAVVPIEAYVASYGRAAQESARLAQSSESPRVEQFTLTGDDA